MWLSGCNSHSSAYQRLRASSHEALVTDIGQDGVEEEDADEQSGSVDDKEAAHFLGDGLWQLQILAQNTCPAANILVREQPSQKVDG